ncbi:MAG: flagella assembly protein FlgT middle domain-containing protein [Rhodocyclaceae bacterium]|nr:flagella assembly protein FlgT middle domain-containing protein [Rhodocyclaceae bacterium]MDZ4214752.1 flagella assembly protein FlgT middle domain-containing protein [Rhodocyclaceae bacterium]
MKIDFRFRLLCLSGLLILGGCILQLPTQPVAQPDATTAQSKPQAQPVTPKCQGLPKRKVLVTAFPMRYPEQIKSGEFMGWAQVTGEELKRAIESKGRLLASSAAHRFPFESADKAPALEQDQGGVLISRWAAQENVQYVIAGVIHDFGVSKLKGVIPERQMHVEAYLYEAHSSTLLARQSFARQLPFGGIPKSVTPGTSEFATSRLGETFNSLIDEMAQWAEETLACLPFSVSVTRVDERRLSLDRGSDAGITVGMAVQSWRPGSAPPARHPSVPATAKPQPTAIIRHVEGKTSIAEIPAQRFPPTVRVGDVLFLADTDGRNKP